MKKLAPLAALLVAAAGAAAQSDCQSHCTKSKDGATVQQVAHEQPAKEGCEGKTVCDSAQTAGLQLVSQQSAQDGCEGKTGCESATGAALQLVAHQPAGDCEGQSSCHGEKGAVQTVAFPADMPRMAYLVGDKETCCPEEAAELASHCDTTKVQYRVNQVAYTDQAEAGKAYAAELERYLDRMTRVSFVVGDECSACPLQAEQLAQSTGQPLKYKVGNTVFDSAEKAIRASALAYGRAQQVKMSYAVDGRETACSETFASAKSCGTTKASYLVAGKETQCDVEAACLLVTARIEAALAAAQQVAQG